MMKKLFKVVGLVIIIAGIPLGLFLVRFGFSLFSRASGEAASLVIDASVKMGTTGQVWRNLAQGGEDKNEDSLKSAVALTREISPRYVRIDHIYDFYDVVSKNNGAVSYNWSKLDTVVGHIRSMGAVPFFSLSYMPSALSSGNELSYPSNWSDWENLVQATVERYSGKNSGISFPLVYYEVWNEPDLFGDFKTYGDKNYLELYSHTATAVARAKNTYVVRVGGPATTGFYPNWVTSLFEYCEKNGLWLDFISWHRYSMKLTDFESDIKKASEIRSRYPRYSQAELIVSEMGHDSKNHPGYDNNFGALHTIALAAVMEDTINRGFSFEIKDGVGGEKLWGRWGILTNEKFGLPEKKPRFSSFLFLNKMDGVRVSTTGQGSWVKAFSKVDGNVLRTLVVNYDQNGSHVETVPFLFKGLTNGSYSFKRSDFLGGVREIDVEVVDGTFQVSEYFGANTASIFELTRK